MPRRFVSSVRFEPKGGGIASRGYHYLRLVFRRPFQPVHATERGARGAQIFNIVDLRIWKRIRLRGQPIGALQATSTRNDKRRFARAKTALLFRFPRSRFPFAHPGLADRQRCSSSPHLDPKEAFLRYSREISLARWARRHFTKASRTWSKKRGGKNP